MEGVREVGKGNERIVGEGEDCNRGQGQWDLGKEIDGLKMPSSDSFMG